VHTLITILHKNSVVPSYTIIAIVVHSTLVRQLSNGVGGRLVEHSNFGKNTAIRLDSVCINESIFRVSLIHRGVRSVAFEVLNLRIVAKYEYWSWY